MAKILLLDSNSLINRAFYAIPTMTTKDGVFTNAVFGYISMLSKLISTHKPTHLCAIFDVKAPTFRHKMYDSYKGTRKPMPEELVPQIPLLKQVLRSMDIKVLELAGYEADDIIGTLAKRFNEETLVVSGDKDVLQLVDDTTVILHTKRGVTDIKLYNLEALAEEDLTPQKVIEYKALAGDSSDNIPGCKGVGAKTAMKLLEDFGDVDGIYQHTDSLKGALKEKIIANKEAVYLSRELATINTQVPIDCTIEDIAFNTVQSSAFYRQLKELEFKKMANNFVWADNAQEEVAPTEEEKQDSIVFSAKNKVDIADIAELTAVLENAKKAGIISINYGKQFTFAYDTDTEYSIEMSEDMFASGIDIEEAMDAVGALCASDIVKIGYDIKAIKHIFKAYNQVILPPYEDIAIKDYLDDVNRVSKTAQELLENYGCKDIAVGQLCYSKHIDAILAQKGLTKLYKEVELPLVDVLFDMEVNGFKIDKQVLGGLSDKYSKELIDLSEHIRKVTDEPTLNINSPKQIGQLLFEKLALSHGKKTKTGYSVSADVLESLDHPIVDAILRYRKISKLQSTYLTGMLAVINNRTDKVHSIFKQYLTVTGRLSSTEPNLQNIPIRSEEGREIRKMFVASAGNQLVSADYSQIELRLLAHFSKDEVLVKAYQNNEDIHAITASKIFGTPFEQVSKDERRCAKAVNFGIIYGISPFGLAKNVGITQAQAKAFQAKYFETYPAVKPYMDSNIATAREQGYISTLMGRRRYFPELKSTKFNVKSFAERATMNMPLQGTASDIIKIAMIEVHKALLAGGYKAKLILQVHDELVIDAPYAEVEAVKALLTKCMENVVALDVPLVAEAKSGNDWFTME